ncbi:MAG: tail fiber domain-containing protein [Bacteroidales bacterium]|nr:tail fiber domain-containing protein [Bacteroidales bacterium]
MKNYTINFKTWKIAFSTIVILILFVSLIKVQAQNIAITDDDGYTAETSAMLDVKSITKGMLIPRVALISIDVPISGTKPEGLLVWNTSTTGDYNTPGFYYWNGSAWVNLLAKSDYSGGIDAALFSVVNDAGDTVFAVYPEGVRIWVDDSPSKATGSKGGFAVGGLNAGKGYTNEYFRITPDSIRMYIDTAQSVKATGSKGGFAVGGLNAGKTNGLELLRVTDDSVRIYIKNNPSKATGSKGGFAVGGFNAGKSETTDYFNISGSTTAEEINNESRVMWYPKKSAFLAGEIHVGSADDVGTNSIALGYRNVAKGNWSQAFGYMSKALGTYSTAIGGYAEADTNSYAFGYNAKALANDAFALGTGAYATGEKSFAFGSVGVDSLGNTTGNTQATGEYAYAFGLGSVASGRGAFALGANDTASGEFATAIGYKTKASGSWYATAMGGYSEATGSRATAIGYHSKASGLSSTALGSYTEALGIYSFAAGRNCIANASYSIAMGRESEAQASYSIALGRDNIASSTGAVAIGYENTASGSYSTAMGYNTSAIGLASFAAGGATSASGSYSTALGYQCITTASYAVAIGRGDTASADYAMALGYNTKASGENSFAMGYRTTAQSFLSLVIGRWNNIAGSTTAWTGTDPLFVVGNGESTSIRNNALTLYKDGDMTIAGALTQNSDKRLKENIVNMENVLPNVLNINPVYFEFKNKKTHPSGRHIGFIAQEIEPLFPELIKKDSKGFLSIEYSNMTAVLLQAIKEQQTIIEKQNKENEKLEMQLKQIMERLEKLESNNKLKNKELN